MEEHDDARRRGSLGWAIALVVVSYTALVLVDPVQFWFDDPFFYLEIARHMLDGDGATFHGLGWTNGYHPLWLLVVTPLVALGEAGLPVLRLVVGVQGGLALASGLLLVAVMRRAELPYPPLSLGVGAITLLGAGLWGSEGWLDATLQLAGLALWLDACADRAPPSRWALAGAALGLAVLARLDLVFLAAAVCCATVLRGGVSGRDRVRDVLWLGGTLTLVLAPYLLSNQLATGHLVPVSGTVKSTFPVPNPGDLGLKLGAAGRNALAGGLVAAVLAATRQGPARWLLGAFAGGALAHGAYVGLFTGDRWSTDYHYYWVTGLLALAFGAGPLYAAFTRWLPSLDAAARSRLGAFLGALLALLGGIRTATRVAEPEPPTVTLGKWLATELPPGAVVFTADAPGRLAWFSGHVVFAVDGLTWGFDLSETLHARGARGWFADLGVTHVVSPLYAYDVPWLVSVPVPGGVETTLRDPWTGDGIGTLDLRVADALVTTRALVPAAEDDDAVGVWPYVP